MEQISQLKQSIEGYKAIQEKQLSEFGHNLFPDIETLNFERASAFAELKNQLNHFLNFSHSDNIESLLLYQAELKHILMTDRRLQDLIAEYKKALTQQINNTCNGKKALTNYGHSTEGINKKTLHLTTG